MRWQVVVVVGAELRYKEMGPSSPLDQVVILTAPLPTLPLDLLHYYNASVRSGESLAMTTSEQGVWLWCSVGVAVAGWGAGAACWSLLMVVVLYCVKGQ